MLRHIRVCDYFVPNIHPHINQYLLSDSFIFQSYQPLFYFTSKGINEWNQLLWGSCVLNDLFVWIDCLYVIIFGPITIVEPWVIVALWWLITPFEPRAGIDHLTCLVTVDLSHTQIYTHHPTSPIASLLEVLFGGYWFRTFLGTSFATCFGTFGCFLWHHWPTQYQTFLKND